MKGKLMTLGFVLAVTALALSPISQAAASVTVFGYTDRAYYKPGETGTINFWVYNSGTEDLILNNVSIYYPWDDDGLWMTNQTITPESSTVITAGGNWSSSATFTVPNDGRSMGGSTNFRVNTDKAIGVGHVQVTVANTPAYLALENMNLLTMLLTLLAIFVLVCGLIIALAILTSGRRHATWRSEPGPA